jgi:hypothetical protein
MAKEVNELDRFMQNVAPEPNSGCWLWTGLVNKHGYGRAWYKKKVMLAHRASYELFCDVNLGSNILCHKCDAPSCVNPDHMFIGVPKDNSLDMVSKNRQSKGTHRPKAKLDENAVLHIRAKLMPQREYAKIYGVSQSKISFAQTGKSWRHVV